MMARHTWLSTIMSLFYGQRYDYHCFENYSDLDSLGRCGVAYANICKDIMPTEERGKIGMIKPSGWHTVKYDVIKDRYLYNRCHLIDISLPARMPIRRTLLPVRDT